LDTPSIQNDARESRSFRQKGSPGRVYQETSKLAILLFDHIFYCNISIYRFDKLGSVIGSSKIFFHLDKKLGDIDYKELNFIVDPVRNQPYVLEKKLVNIVYPCLIQNHVK